MKKNHKHTVSRCVVRLHKLAEQRIKCGEIVALQLRVGAPAKDLDELAQRPRLGTLLRDEPVHYEKKVR